MIECLDKAVGALGIFWGNFWDRFGFNCCQSGGIFCYLLKSWPFDYFFPATHQWYWLRSFAYRCGLYLKILAYFEVSVLVVELLPLNLILSCLCTSGTGCGVAYNS